MKRKASLTLGTTLILGLVALPALSVVGNISGTDSYAWSETSGWMTARPSDAGVTVHGAYLSGYAWSEGIGYVKLGVDAGGPYANTGMTDWGVNRNGSALSGYGWSETSGWIRFDPTHGGVRIDAATGSFSGYAWSEGVGFVHFQDASVTAYQVRLVFPGNPTSLAATSGQLPSIWSTANAVDMGWSGASDNGAGLGGYSVLFDQVAGSVPDAVADVAHPTQSFSQTLGDATDHYFHLRACDAVGNCAPTALHIGPYWIDGTPPQVALLHTVADTGDGELAAGEATAAAITQLAVIFDEDVRDPGGDTADDDVTNPNNYLLFGPGGDGTYETVDCTAGVAASDTALGIDAVIYDAASTTAYLKLAAGTPLARGPYRLHTCGTTSILDPAGNALDGDGDGTGGDDFALDWAVTVDQLLANPNFDDDLASWTGTTPGASTYSRSIDDAALAPTSGSAEVVNVDGAGDFELAAECVDLGAETGLFQSGDLRVANGAGADPASWLRLSFFDRAGCTGTTVAELLPAITTGETALAWPRLQGWVDVPDGALSVRATFGTTAGAANNFTAGWDSTSLYQMLFGNGFEEGDTQGWSNSVP